MAEMGKLVTSRGKTGVQSTRGVADSVDPTWTSTLPHLCLTAGTIMGHKVDKAMGEGNSSGVMTVNGRE